MPYLFSHSRIGFTHLQDGKPCQDFSSSYSDPERSIITCCDGHGGKRYVRSRMGSKLASAAVHTVFRSLDPSLFRRGEEAKESVRLAVLCEYNRLIEREIAKKPFRKKELSGLDEEEIANLRLYPAKAYGTTLTGAMEYRGHLLVIAIGDTEALGIRKGELVRIFDNSLDPAGNVTYSMCQDDAYAYLRVALLDAKDLDGILLCSDGLASPYRSYENFTSSFIKPMVRKLLLTGSSDHVAPHLDAIASSLGVGDDVSLAFLIHDHVNPRFYK